MKKIISLLILLPLFALAQDSAKDLCYPIESAELLVNGECLFVEAVYLEHYEGYCIQRKVLISTDISKLILFSEPGDKVANLKDETERIFYFSTFNISQLYDKDNIPLQRYY